MKHGWRNLNFKSAFFEDEQKKSPLASERSECVPAGTDRTAAAAALGSEGGESLQGRRGTWEDAAKSTARWMRLIEESGNGSNQLTRRLPEGSSPFPGFFSSL